MPSINHQRTPKTLLVSIVVFHFCKMVKNNAEHWLSYKNYARTWTKIDRKKVSFGCITIFQRFWKWLEEYSQGGSFLQNLCILFGKQMWCWHVSSYMEMLLYWCICQKVEIIASKKVSILFRYFYKYVHYLSCISLHLLLKNWNFRH